MAIAIPIQYAVSSDKESGLCVPLWVEFHDFKSPVRAISHKRNIVFFRHRMRQRNTILVLQPLALHEMAVVFRFYFQGRQPDSAAGYDRRPCGMQSIPADRADIELGFQHIGRTVGVDNLLAGQQFRQRDP